MQKGEEENGGLLWVGRLIVVVEARRQLITARLVVKCFNFQLHQQLSKDYAPLPPPPPADSSCSYLIFKLDNFLLPPPAVPSTDLLHMTDTETDDNYCK